MGHSHEHHHHGTENIKTAFWLNLGFCIIEFAGGILSNSVSILADSLHDFGDSLSLGIAWYFQKKSNLKEDKTYNYGYGRFSVVGALINAIILVTGSIYILYESVYRLINPEPSDGKIMFFLAILGIIINGMAILRLKSGSSLNEKVVMWHLLEDVLGWVAVLIGSTLIYFFHWNWIDPLLSLGISAFVLWNVFKNLKSVFRVILQGIPEEVDVKEIKELIISHAGIKEIHDLRIWSLDGHYCIMTLHVVKTTDSESSDLKKLLKNSLRKEHISHVTIEMEEENEKCIEIEEISS